MGPGPERSISSEINVTPFLDVLLVLIIVFLSAMTTRKTIDAQLPVPCHDLCAGSERVIVLEVLRDRRYVLNTRPVAGDSLFLTLQKVYSGRPEKVLHVAGHRDARYGDIVAAMDVARSAGVRVIAIPPRSAYEVR